MSFFTSALDYIKQYYLSINSTEFNAHDWFEDNVQNYITKKNITADDIGTMHSENTEFTERNSTIDESSFVLNRGENETNYWQFMVHFTCHRTAKNNYQSCNILVEIGINNSTNKIISYKELEIKDLVFSNEPEPDDVGD